MPAWLEPKLAVTRNGAGGSAVAFPEPFCLAESWLCLISGRKAMKLLTAPDSEIEAGGLGRMQDPFFFFLQYPFSTHVSVSVAFCIVLPTQR